MGWTKSALPQDFWRTWDMVREECAALLTRYGTHRIDLVAVDPAEAARCDLNRERNAAYRAKMKALGAATPKT